MELRNRAPEGSQIARRTIEGEVEDEFVFSSHIIGVPFLNNSL
jgi:hypothetical protein